MNKSLLREVAIAAIGFSIVAFLIASLAGCVQYKGGKYIEGTNLAVGMTIPGTEWQINVLDYVGGLRVAGDDHTTITVKNEVEETSSWFGVVSINRKSAATAQVKPEMDIEDEK